MPSNVASLLQASPDFEQMGGAPLALYDWSGASGAVGGYMPGMAQSGPKFSSFLYIGGNPAVPAARCIGGNGELQIYNDPEYIPSAANPFGYDGGAGTFSISTSAMPSGVDPSLSDSKPYIGGCLTTQNCFTSTYGYWEASIQAPPLGDTGTWLTFWLLPAVKTALNGGQTPEVDIFELENVRINTDGSVQYNTTLHARTLVANANAYQVGSTLTVSGLTGGEGAIPVGTYCSQFTQTITAVGSVDASGNGTYTMSGSNSFGASASPQAVAFYSLPPNQVLVHGASSAGNPGSLADNAFHTYGCYVDPDTIAIIIDGVEVYSGANAGVLTFDDAHYAVLSLAAGGTNLSAEQVTALNPVDQTASFKWLRHYPLAA